MSLSKNNLEVLYAMQGVTSKVYDVFLSIFRVAEKPPPILNEKLFMLKFS